MRSILFHLGVPAIFLIVLPATAQEPQHRPAEQSPRVVACRVKETHASRDPAVGLVVFGQRDKADSERFHALLRRAQEGGPVEFQASEGATWQQARIVRLRSCFGRGLLILAGGAAAPAEGSTLLVRFPVSTLKPAASPTVRWKGDGTATLTK